MRRRGRNCPSGTRRGWNWFLSSCPPVLLLRCAVPRRLVASWLCFCGAGCWAEDCLRACCERTVYHSALLPARHPIARISSPPLSINTGTHDFSPTPTTHPYNPQDVLNIHYNHSPAALYLLPCRWNLRPETDATCGWGAGTGPGTRVHDVPAEALDWEAEAMGAGRAGVLHGSRGAMRRADMYGPYADRVMDFGFSDRGSEEKQRAVGQWPAGRR